MGHAAVWDSISFWPKRRHTPPLRLTRTLGRARHLLSDSGSQVSSFGFALVEEIPVDIRSTPVTSLILLFGRLLGMLIAVVALFLITLTFYGNATGVIANVLGKALPPVGANTIALLISGALLGCIHAPLGVYAFGGRVGAAITFLCGAPLAALSFPPSPEAYVSNYGVVGYVGAVSCTLLAGLVVLVIGKFFPGRTFRISSS